MATDDPTSEPPIFDKTDGRDTKDAPTVTLSNHLEPIVTRRELWSYYLYLNGTVVLYTTTIFQSLTTAAGYDPVRGPGSSCLDSHASGKTKAVSSVVLLSNGISFAMMTIVLTLIGPAADYESFGRWSLFVATFIYWSSMFSTMSLTGPSRWGVAMGLYTIGNISFGVAYALYSAIFPGLARNTKHSRNLRDRYNQGEISLDMYKNGVAFEKSKISSFSYVSASIGFVTTSILSLALLIPIRGNPRVDNYVILSGVIFQQPRPGPKLPKGEHYLTIGWKQIWISLKQCKKLPNTFTYLVAYFLLADGVNTMLSLIQICQNVHFRFSFKQNSFLGIIEGCSSVVGLVAYWYLRNYLKTDVKKMLIATSIVAVVLPLWGMIGIWTNKFGYHNTWEFWLYYTIYGLFEAPYCAYSQTVMAELSPPGFDYMFFGLFGLTNRVSSILGPNVTQAIINETGNTWQGFPFLFAICLSATLIIWLAVDVPKGRQDAERWAAEHRGTACDACDV
ncbi:autophagy-related protein 22-like protein [Russula dissimulans]|nr:autophagy-related protein 22-like protein [Russula dissimulans]